MSPDFKERMGPVMVLRDQIQAGSVRTAASFSAPVAGG
jgi:hypothetical protein